MVNNRKKRGLFCLNINVRNNRLRKESKYGAKDDGNFNLINQ